MVNRLLFWLLFSFLSAWSFAGSHINISLRDTTSFVGDQTFFSFDNGQSDAFVLTQDALKIFSPDSTVAQLYSFTSDDSLCLSNSMAPLTGCRVLPLGYRASAGTYRISQTAFTDFDEGALLLLEDRTLGKFTNLLAQDYIFTNVQFEQSDTRFYLHISPAPVVSTTAAGCNNDDGVISINQQNCLTWTEVHLFLGAQPVTSFTNATGVFSFTGLEEGSYNVAFSYGSNTITLPVTLEGHQVQARINASTLNAVTAENIQFSAIATNATGFDWEFGDGSQISGVANPDYFFSEPGTYTVTLVCTNSFGCSATATVTVVVTQGTGTNDLKPFAAKVYSSDKILFVYSNDASQSQNLKVYDATGQTVFHAENLLLANDYNLSDLANGLYVVSVESLHGHTVKKVFLHD